MSRDSHSPRLAFWTMLVTGTVLNGQTPPAASPQTPQQPTGGRGGGGFCHGTDARGGEGSPNLIRCGLVLNDDKVETIAPVVRQGRAPAFSPETGLIDLTSGDSYSMYYLAETGSQGARWVGREKRTGCRNSRQFVDMLYAFALYE